MRKSPAMIYCLQLMNSISKEDLEQRLRNSPLTDDDVEFVLAVAHGMTNQDLAEKFHISESRVSSKKRELSETLHRYSLNLKTKY